MGFTSTEVLRGFRWAALAALAAAALSGCAGRPPRLAPIPDTLTSIEGDGSLSLTGPGGTARSRFSFILLTPGRARIDVFDPLGRLVYFLLITDDQALMAVPSKKAFGRGSREEVIARFLGFGLTPGEIASLLTGRWPEGGFGPEALGGDAWTLQRDDRNRVASGERGYLRFNVREFFPDSTAARLLAFEHLDSKGRIKVRYMAFNRPRPGATEAATLLKGYNERTWREMEALLSDED